MQVHATLYQSGVLDEQNRKLFGEKQAWLSEAFHRTFAGYQKTPLICLKYLAASAGVRNIFVKDESGRFGLNAFKGLGGSYALSSYIARELKTDLAGLSYDSLVSPETRERLGEIQFVTATDGNHGRGIAWAARRLGHRAKVFMPKGSAIERCQRILDEGAECSITDQYYDDTVADTFQKARKNNWVMAQDTTIEGCSDDFPIWCMQGYLTMAKEALEQMTVRMERPTHIFLQAGAGSMAAALAAYFTDALKDHPPVIGIVESEKCDCFRRTAEHNDGRRYSVDGDISTIMAGLSVGVPSRIAWDIFRGTAHAFLSVDDSVAALGCRILGNPLGSDPHIISGESGSVGLGTAYVLLRQKRYADLRRALHLDRNASILCFSTEGDTDADNYRNIVWNGDWQTAV